jgi:hypothetical protein
VKYDPLLAYVIHVLTGAQRTRANRDMIEALAPRVKALAESLCAPVSEGDTREESRRKALEL